MWRVGGDGVVPRGTDQQGHSLPHPFTVFGYHVTGSTGALFLYGLVVGAVAVFGLSLLLTGARRTSRRGRIARGELKQSRRDEAAVRHDRDYVLGQRDTARAEASAAQTSGGPSGNGHTDPYDDSRHRHRVFWRRSRAPT